MENVVVVLKRNQGSWIGKLFLYYLDFCNHRWARGGVGVVCTPPLKPKITQHIPLPKAGEVCTPVSKTRQEKKFLTPLWAYFLSFFCKITPLSTNKTPHRKKIFTPRWKKILAAEGGRKFFLSTHPCVHTPLVPKPMPTYVQVDLDAAPHVLGIL